MSELLQKNRLGCEPATLLPAARVLSGLDICSALLFLPLAPCLSHIAALSFQTGGLRGSKKHWHIYNGPVHTANMPHTHAGYTLSQKQNSALVPGNRQVTYKWWIWQCCGAAAECCKKKKKRVTDTYTPFYENKSGTLNKRRVLHIWQTGHQQKLDISPAPTHVFAKAAVILITCQSRRLPLWNRRKIKETQHLTSVLKVLRASHIHHFSGPYFFHVSKLQTAGKRLRIWCIVWLGCNLFSNIRTIVENVTYRH